MGKQTPTMTFQGGPLDGAARPKHEVGRWSTYRDADGTPVPTSKIEKYRVPGAGMVFALYQLVEPTGVLENAYRWIPQEK